MTRNSLRTLLVPLLLALPAAAQFGLSPGGVEGLRVKIRPLGGEFQIGGQGNDTALAGKPGSGLPIDGFEMRYFQANLEYQALVDGLGWQPWVKAGKETGVAGKKILGLRVKVNKGSVRYRVASLGGDFTEWGKDGDAVQSPKGIEAIEAEFLRIAKPGQTLEFRVAWKGEPGFGPWLKGGSTADAGGKDTEITAVQIRSTGGGSITCEPSFLGKGFRPSVDQGETCGDLTGTKRIDSFRFFSTDFPIRCRAKDRLEGFPPVWSRDGEPCGLVGRGHQIIALQIEPDPGGTNNNN
jgi:hypothetical protein